MTAPSRDDFVGEYQIRQGSVVDPNAAALDPRKLVKVDRTIEIVDSAQVGTDALDFTLYDESGVAIFGPFACDYLPDAAVLYHRDEDYEGSGQPMALQVSLYRDEKSGYKAAYGLMVFGDPDNVGVWGADESG